MKTTMKMALMGSAASLLAVGSMYVTGGEADARVAASTSPTVTVSSSITSGVMTVRATGSNGVTCSGDCCQASAGTVDFVYQTSSGQFLYVVNSSGAVSTSPPSSVAVTASSPGSVDFSVVGADGTGSTLLWHDPIIIVQTGTCGGGLDDIRR